MKFTHSLYSLAIASGIASSAIADGYLIGSGQSDLAFSISHTSFDQFWAGSAKQPGVPGGGNIERTSFRVYYHYGLENDTAIDLSIGYADTSSGLSDGSDFTDSSIGLSWQGAVQSEDGIDWILRGAVNIAGDYDVGVLSAPGDGENGFDIMTKFGKTLGSNGIRADAEIGYTLNDGDAPDSFRLRAGPTFPVSDGFSIDLTAIYFTGIDGIDIGGAGFTGLGDLPKVEERATAGEIGFAFNAGSGYYRLSISQIFDGRNIGEELTLGAFGSFRF